MTKIEWLRNTDGSQGKTWNPIVGCSPCSPGCDNCYALSFARRHAKNPTLPAETREAYAAALTDGKWNGTTHLISHKAYEPRGWKKPQRIFVCSMGDLFHPSVCHGIATHIFDAIGFCPQHTFLLLTKRPEGIRRLLYEPAAVRWVSVEPCLGPISLEYFLTPVGAETCHWGEEHRAKKCECEHESLDWVVMGPETGLGARPMDLDWARDLEKECYRAGVPFFLKKIKLDGHEHREIPIAK